jgi:hypothetical protein
VVQYLCLGICALSIFRGWVGQDLPLRKMDQIARGKDIVGLAVIWWCIQFLVLSFLAISTTLLPINPLLVTTTKITDPDQMWALIFSGAFVYVATVKGLVQENWEEIKSGFGAAARFVLVLGSFLLAVLRGFGEYLSSI